MKKDRKNDNFEEDAKTINKMFLMVMSITFMLSSIFLAFKYGEETKNVYEDEKKIQYIEYAIATKTYKEKFTQILSEINEEQQKVLVKCINERIMMNKYREITIEDVFLWHKPLRKTEMFNCLINPLSH